MSEPAAVAPQIDAVLPGLLHWTVEDDRIESRSDAWALTTGPDTLLVDPLPLEVDALGVLGGVRLVVLTIQSHQRSAWRMRRHFRVPVLAPIGSVGLEEQPDYWYEDGAELPGGLRAFHSPGPCAASHALLAPRPEGSVLFVGDLLVGSGDGRLRFAASRHLDDPVQTRESVRRLLALEPAVVCSGHGAAVISGGAAAMRRALDEDAGP